MKLLLNKTDLKSYMEDSANVKFGIGWYRHHKDHKWFGFTLEFYLYFWLLQITFVDNYKEYDKRMNRRYDPDYMKKLGERLTIKKKEDKE